MILDILEFCSQCNISNANFRIGAATRHFHISWTQFEHPWKSRKDPWNILELSLNFVDGILGQPCTSKINSTYLSVSFRAELYPANDCQSCLAIFWLALNLGMWLCSQFPKFSQFWFKSCHVWDQCKSSKKLFPCRGGRSLWCSGTAFQMLWLHDVSDHFSQFRVWLVSSLENRIRYTV